MARIKASVVTDFLDLQTNLLTILKAYGITQKYVYTSIGMPRATWTMKVKFRRFDGHEMFNIVTVINK